jgi:hypothetical protein
MAVMAQLLLGMKDKLLSVSMGLRKKKDGNLWEESVCVPILGEAGDRKKL